MVDAIGIAVSGLNLATRVASTAAGNIAGAGVTGRADGSGTYYTPQDVVAVANGAGGVNGQTVDRDPASVPVYAPDSPSANEDGIVSTPNVDMATEMITLKQAELAYRANISVIKTAAEMQDDLLKSFDETV